MYAEKIVKAANAKFDEAVANVHSYSAVFLKIANSKIDSIVEQHDDSAGLFVSRKKKVFFTNIESLDEKSIGERIEKASKAIDYAKPKEDYFGIAEGRFKYRRQQYDKQILNYDSSTAIRIASDAIDGAKEAGAENIAGTVSIGYSKSELATSTGLGGNSISTFVRLSLRVFRNGLSFQNITASRSLGKVDARKFGTEAGAFISKTRKTGTIRSGNYDIVYMPQPAGLLLENVNAMACIGSIENGSYLAGKLGKKIADSNITIYDDGAIASGINSSPYDAEGYPTQRTAIIRNGILKSYLHNHSTAKKYKTKSTGNAGLVMPSPNTMVFEHRRHMKNLDALIGSVDKGILVTNTWYTRFSSYLKGDFSTVPRDLTIYIEHGEPQFAIRQPGSGFVGIRINENMLRMLKGTIAAGGSAVQTSSWDAGNDYFFVPNILVRNVKLTVA